MGHSINITACKEDRLDEVLDMIYETAYDPQETSGYHGNMSIHREICKDEEEARRFIEENDTGWYSDHAVRFRRDGEKFWLIKYEYHC